MSGDLADISSKLFSQGNENLLSKIFNQGNPVQTIRNMTALGSQEIIESMIDKVDMLKSGGEFIQAAIATQKNDMLKYYIKKGAQLDLPPDSVQKMYTDSNNQFEYRKSPFIIQAACSGNLDCFKTLQQAKCKINDKGYICLSKKRRNQVSSNVAGAAAYHGHINILRYVSDKVPLNECAKEKQDHQQKGAFQKEFSEFNPLQLAVAGGDNCLECARFLIQRLDPQVIDFQGNSLLHIAAIYGNTDILEYLLREVKLSIFERNNNGETALFIAEEKKNERAIKLLQQYQNKEDYTKANADELIKELESKQEQEEQKKHKKKEKKKRQRIRQLAEREGVTYEEMEQRLEKEKEDEELKYEEQQREQEESERKEAEEQRKRLEEIKKQQEEQERKKKLKKMVHYEEEKQVEAPTYQTQYAYLKVKKPQEKPKQEIAEVKEEPKKKEEEQKPKQKKEEVKVSMNRKQRKYIERQKELEQRMVQKQEEQQWEEGESESDLEEEEQYQEEGKREVIGLESEMKLATLQSKKARRRLRKKMTKQQEEEEQLKEKLRKLGEEKEAERRRLEEEEEEMLRKEEEEKNKKYTYFKEEPRPVYQVKQKATNEKKPKYKQREEEAEQPAKKVKYVPKPKANIEQDAKDINYSVKDVEQQDVSQLKEKVEQEQLVQASEERKQEAVKSPPNSPYPPPQEQLQVPLPSKVYDTQGLLQMQHVKQLQDIILVKENEIHSLRETLSRQEKEIENLKAQKVSHIQIVEDKELRSKMNHINEQLLKEKAVNRLINEQLLENEKLLKEEENKRKQVEDKLFQFVYDKQTNKVSKEKEDNNEQDLLDIANEELKKREILIRQLQNKLDIYEARNLDSKNQLELKEVVKVMQDSLKKVQSAADSKRH